MKKYRLPAIIFNIICLVACVIFVTYIGSLIIDGVNSVNEAENPGATSGVLAIAGVLILVIGLFYAPICSAVSIIPLALSIKNNKVVKQTGEGKKLPIWLPIIEMVTCPIMLVVLIVFIQNIGNTTA